MKKLMFLALGLLFLSLSVKGQEIEVKMDKEGYITQHSIEIAQKNPHADFFTIVDGKKEKLIPTKCGPNGCSTAGSHGLCGFVRLTPRGPRSWSFRGCKSSY